MREGVETAESGMDKREKSGAFFLNMKPAPFRHLQSSRALWLTVAAGILFAVLPPFTAQAAGPAELISSFRRQHGEGRVASDPVLNRIAQEQAKAMAARDVMDHAALRPFSDRVANLNAERAAENIATGYNTFPKTLDQWIGSYGHRSNLLMHDATRVGIASAKSSKSGETYWAMVIAGPEPTRAKHRRGAAGKSESCRLMLNDLCL